MMLIVFYPMVCAYEVSCTSFKLWIPPVSFMKRRTDIKWIINTGEHSGISTQLYKLFRPINAYSNGERNNGIFPNQGMKDKDFNTQRNIDQRKEMPPGKLQYLFSFTPDWLYKIHRFFLHIHHQDITSLTKHTLSIISRYRTMSFQESPAFEGGQIHEI